MTTSPVNILRHSIIFIQLFFGAASFAQINKASANLSSQQLFTPSDTTAKLHLRNVIISGNRKTKDYIIAREMHINAGDSINITSLNNDLEKMRQNIYNTTLFVEVKVEPVIISAFDFDINVSVKERWYIFPIPQFQLVDRSFNEWLNKYNGSLDRVNYGIKFSDFNASGRKDEVNVIVINGFTRNITVGYNNPYANKALTHGNKIEASYSQTREIPFKTSFNNNYVYYRDKDFINETWTLFGAFSIRKAIKKKQTFNLAFTHIKVADSIVSSKFNPEYLNSYLPYKNILDVSYNLQYNDVDNILFPLKGYTAKVDVAKRGLGFTGGINMFSIQGNYNKYISLGKKWYTSLIFIGKIKIPFKQAYINQGALGIGDLFVRGLELYVIDGVATGVAKFDLKKEILHFTVPTIFKKSKIYNKLPFRFYAKTFADVGYSYLKDEPPTLLNNKLLYSGGIGLTVVTLYDINIKIEYSLNQLRQNNLFLHTR